MVNIGDQGNGKKYSQPVRPGDQELQVRRDNTGSPAHQLEKKGTEGDRDDIEDVYEDEAKGYERTPHERAVS